MTDRPAPPRLTRANPAPRRALPRVTPLGAGGSADALPAHPVAAPAAAADPVEEEATGRDLLIPNGGSASGRKGRGSATVPTLAELMPPSRPAGAGKARPGKDHAGKDQGKEHGKENGKVVEVQVTLSKGLRKRLKAKAADMGLSPEDAIAQLVEVWVDG